MSYPTTTIKKRLPEGVFAIFLLLSCALISFIYLHVEAIAQTSPTSYGEAENAFMGMSLDQRIKMQVLLTAAGYWPAVPTASFSTRLFDAIEKFQGDNGFVALGVLNNEQMEKLQLVGGSYLNRWNFEAIKHPMANVEVWVPMGLPMFERLTPAGLAFTNSSYGVLLAYDFYPEFNLRFSFEALLSKLRRNGSTIYYTKLYQGDFFVVSYSDGGTDAYVRYHQLGTGGIGFSLYWNHNATDAHIERIATLISGSLWSAVTGAPFISPFTVRPEAPSEVARAASPTPEPQQPAPSPVLPQPERHTASSGTGHLRYGRWSSHHKRPCCSGLLGHPGENRTRDFRSSQAPCEGHSERPGAFEDKFQTEEHSCLTFDCKVGRERRGFWLPAKRDFSD